MAGSGLTTKSFVAALLAALTLSTAGGCAVDGNDAGDVAVRVTYATPGDSASGLPTSSATPSGLLSPTTLGDPHGAFTTELFASGLTKPLDLQWRVGDPVPYVVEQGGRILRLDGTDTPAVALDVDATRISTGGEQGLLGLAFHPSLPLAYVNYTDARGDTHIAEFAVREDGTLDEASERTVLVVQQPYENHNGGALAFGPDELLYIALGDGGSGGDPERAALDASELLGKLLRIDPLERDGRPYTVPSDNPYVGTTGARQEIWSLGLRNPWRFSFDTSTGDLWIGDVGQETWEEIDYVRAADGAGRGANFGWSAYEGEALYNDDQPTAGVTMPVAVYQHGGRCSVVGGTVYRGEAIPELRGWYVFSDHCDGILRTLRLDEQGAVLGPVSSFTAGNVVAIVSDPDGELYVLDHGGGTIERLVPR